jgi:hypothetical protein
MILMMCGAGKKFMDGILAGRLCATLLVLAAGATHAADIYVAGNGSDSNPGSRSAPLKTIAAAVQAANPGDTVWLSPGQYQESLVPNRSGSNGQPITFRKLGPGPSVIVAPSGGAQKTAIFVNGVTDIVVDGIDANGGAAAPTAAFVSFVTVSNSSRVVVRNGTYANANGWWGIGVNNNSSYVVIQNNSVDMVGQFVSPKTNGGSGEGILVQYGNPTHVLVEGNRVTHCGHDLMSIGSEFNIAEDNYLNNDWTDVQGTAAGFRNAVVIGNNNVFQRNYLSHSGPGPASYRSTTILRVEGSNNIARQNVLTNGFNQAFQSTAGPWTANGSGNRIYNNTASDIGGPAWAEQIYQPGYTRGNDVFQNNLIVNSRIAPPDYDNDVVFWVQTESQGPTSGSAVIANLIVPAAGKTATIMLGPTPGSVPLQAPGAAVATLVSRNLVGVRPVFAAAPVATSSSALSSAAVAIAAYRLSAGSPGLAQGAFLTKATAQGQSTTVPVADASFFIDGFGIIPGDMVKLQGSSQSVRVTHVDYAANTLTVAQSVAFSSGQGVALDYQGTAPDIGAGGMGGAPAPPNNVQVKRN